MLTEASIQNSNKRLLKMSTEVILSNHLENIELVVELKLLIFKEHNYFSCSMFNHCLSGQVVVI